MAVEAGEGPPPGEAGPKARRGASRASPLALEVRELREELRAGLDQLQEGVLQPLRELREAVGVGPRPAQQYLGASAHTAGCALCARGQAGLDARSPLDDTPALVKELLLGQGAPARGLAPDEPPPRRSTCRLREDDGMIDRTLSQNSVNLGLPSPASNRSSFSEAMASGFKHLHIAQQSVKNHLYHQQGLDAEVDHDIADASCCLRRIALTVVKKHHTTFELLIGFVILANSVCIGVEIELSLNRSLQDLPLKNVMVKLELMFLSIYIIELLLRFIADGVKVFRSQWFVFDCAMVIVGGVSSMVNSNFESSMSSPGMDLLEQAPLVRNLRLVRLVRAVRMIELFSDLWKLCMGLMKSARTVASAGMLVTMVAYVFGCVGVELIAKSESLRDDPITGPIVEEYFSSVPQVLLTLTQFVNADSIGAIYSPLVRKKPALSMYFILLIGVVTILLMNLVTAAVVESAIRTGRDDFEMQRHRIMKQVARIVPQVDKAFRAMDITQDGKLDRDELEQLEHISQRLGLPHELRHLLQADKLKDLFDILDRDKDGQVGAVEFVEGICKIALSSVPVETMQMLSLLRQQQAKTLEVRQHVNELQHILTKTTLPPWHRSWSAPPGAVPLGKEDRVATATTTTATSPAPPELDAWQPCPAVPERVSEGTTDNVARLETSEGEEEDCGGKTEIPVQSHEAGSGTEDRADDRGVFAGPCGAGSGVLNHVDDHEVVGGDHETGSRIHDGLRLGLGSNVSGTSVRVCL